MVEEVTTDLSWQLKGTCRSRDPEEFFHPEGERDATKRQRIARAKAVCRECPVLAQCREYVLENREEYGIWAGLSEDEREDLRAGKKLHPTAELYVVPVAVTSLTVSPQPVIEHVQQLLDAGFTTSDIARFSGVNMYTIRSLVRGERKHTYADTAQKLLSIQVRVMAA